MGLRENIRQAPISDLEPRPYVGVRPGTSVRRTVEEMKAHASGAAIIVDGPGRPIGMFNEKLLMRLLADNPKGMEDPVEQHMTGKVACLKRSDPIAKLIATMQQHKLRWVCVVDDEGKSVGITGLRSVISYVADYFPRSVKVQPFDATVSIKNREGA